METTETARDRINARWKEDRQRKIDESNRKYAAALEAEAKKSREVEWAKLDNFHHWVYIG